MLTVTVDIFSGRPDPSWTLQDDSARGLLAQVAEIRTAITPAEEMRSVLGFRGVVLELDNALASEFGMERAIRIGSGLSDAEDDALDVARRIVETMPVGGADADELTPDLRDSILEQMQETNAPAVKTVAAAFPPPEPGEERGMLDGNCRYEVQPYDPVPWNSPAHVKENNCYNFGTNRMWDNFAQPGWASGIQTRPPFTCQSVSSAFHADGLRLRGQGAPASAKPRFIVAMAVYPNGDDYHWWRQCSTYWAHKPGKNPCDRPRRGRQTDHGPGDLRLWPLHHFLRLFLCASTHQSKGQILADHCAHSIERGDTDAGPPRNPARR